MDLRDNCYARHAGKDLVLPIDGVAQPAVAIRIADVVGSRTRTGDTGGAPANGAG